MFELDVFKVNLFELNFITIMFRTFLAILVGGLIGTERDVKQRAAGMRTHMLVCMGAAIVMMTNEYVVITYPDLGVDLTRMGAQVVSGIGFIGAGTILVTSENRVKGLTTAAGLWAAATLGLAIGIGFYEIAVVGALAIIGIVIFLAPIKKYLHERTSDTEVTLMIHARNGFRDFVEATSNLDIKISNIKIEKEVASKEDADDTDLIFTVHLSLGEQTEKKHVFEHIRLAENILEVTEVEY